MLGIGPFPFEGEEDADLINAEAQTITTMSEPFFDSATSFSMIRGQHVSAYGFEAMEVTRSKTLPTGKYQEKW